MVYELETRDRILQAAARHYAEFGYDGMSMRALTKDAEANLAAVNYHFGSKQELIFTLIRHHVEPMNTERIHLLDTAKASMGGAPLPLSTIVDALLTPMANRAKSFDGGMDAFLKAMGRFMGESDELSRKVFVEFFKDISMRFVDELQQTLPHLSAKELNWRFHFTVSCMIGTFLRQGLFQQIGLMGNTVEDVQLLMQRLNHYICGGLNPPMEAALS